MGSKASGNRKPRIKADKREKSYSISVGINPRKDEHRWFAEYLEKFERGQQQNPPDKRLSRGDFIIQRVRLSEGIEPYEPTLTANAHDIADIRAIVQYIMERLESGVMVQSGNKRAKREKAKPLSSGMAATIDHYIDSGFSGTDDLDED